MGTVTHLGAARFEHNNDKLGAKVMLRMPRWVPAKLALFLDRNFGKEGLVVSVDTGEYSKETLYSVIFEAAGAKTTSGVYFENDITFLTAGLR
jgi:hypothetical protein